MPAPGEHEPTTPDEAQNATLAAQIGALRPTPDAIAQTFEHELVRHELERALFGKDGAQREAQPAIDRYPLERKLGEGAMGSVYVGRDERLGRAVAIKLLRGATTTQARARLEREAMSLARLSHPNVVQIYEFGEVEDVPFMVMELVDGVTMRTWLDATSRSLEDIVSVYREAGKGLAAAHQKGIVHRDFKPDNVMVDRSGRVLVMDFGLAAPEGLSMAQALPEADAAEPTNMELTTTGTILGTPAYMAPEQFLGQPSDARTDQFAFCVSLWEALYGERPFSGVNVATLSSAVIEGEHVAPRRSGVPRKLRRALERGFARDPDQRWPSMEALLDALSDASRRRGRARIWLLAASCTALAVGAGLALLDASDEIEQPSVVSAPVVTTIEKREISMDAPAPAEQPEQPEGALTPPALGTKSALVFGFGCKDPDPEQAFPLANCELLRNAAQKLARDPSTLAELGQGARIVPALSDGEVRGYKLYAIRDGSLWTLLGFKNGDKIVALNGQLPQPEVPLRWLEPDTEAISIEVERKGERAFAHIQLVDRLSVEPLVLEQLDQ